MTEFTLFIKEFIGMKWTTRSLRLSAWVGFEFKWR